MTTRKENLKPQSILPVEFTTEEERAMDSVLREMFRVPYPAWEFTNPDICLEVALEELASRVGVGYPRSVLYNPILCLDCRRALVKNAYRITNHGTEEALETFAIVSESNYDYIIDRNTDGRPFRIQLTISITQEQNTEPYQTYYTQAYRELLPFNLEKSVTVQVQWGEAILGRSTYGHTERGFYYFLDGESDFP